MLEPQLSPLVAGLADAVSKSVDIRQAFELVVSEFRRTTGISAWILRRQGALWSPAHGARDVSRTWRVTAEELAFQGESRVTKLIGPDGPATAILLSTDRESDLVLMLDGDLTGSEDVLSGWSLALAHALKVVRARDAAKRTEQLLVRGYAMARRLSRVNNVDSVARRFVADISNMFGAERVSLALYRKAEGHLTIAATHGYPASMVDNVRINPGEWVIGHVYSTKRPVIVRDIRTLAAGASRRDDQYRTFSFAAVPVVAGTETIGVLSVTDKRDDSAFGRQDLVALRAMGVWAGIALASARIEGEAARLAYAATIDSLTGLLNRPYLDSRLHQEVERAKRENGTLAVLIADIDDFKSINDRWGHQVGDTVLQAVGSVIRSAVRVFDVCARYGGDEFAIVMPSSDRASAIACAERIRRRLAEYRTGGDDQPQMTMSIGVAVFTAGDSASDLIMRADRCMYQAKAQGKNLVLAQASWLEEPPLAQIDPDLVPDRLIEAVLGPRVDEEPDLDEDETRRGDLPYVLVADAHEDRAAFCRESVSGLQRGLLIARDGEQALRAIERFGPPALLIVDLALPVKDGFEVIETMRRDMRRRPEIIAWASSREMREYAASRLSRHDVHVIGDSASPATMRAAIAHALEPDVDEREPAPPAAEPDNLRQKMEDLANRARQLCGAPGVAVYMRAPNDSRYQASFTWMSDDLMPHSPLHLPQAFERITHSGDSIVMRDVTVAVGAASPELTDDAVRGFAGVPIVADREVLGAICVFDIEPLDLDDRTLASLRALGHVTFDGSRVMLPALPAAGFRDRASDRDPSGNPVVEDRIRVDAVDWPPSLLERQGGEFAVARELARARREGHQLSVILFDLAPAANVEPVVDDEALEKVTDTLLRAIRQSDLPIRWSGSELLVVLPGLADTQARSVAERVRAALHAGARHRLAISGGVAELKSDERFGDVVDRARQRVAMARGRGHNRVL
jgi:diguanylate cyclase (GGDEF)-like protein